MSEKEIPHYRSEDLNALVRAKYPGPAYTFLNELRDGTAFSTAGRSADAIAFGTWPSRGLSITGFEYKSYRGDWLNELKKPEKAESIARFCDSWYLVCAENVAKLEEIPQAWGWLAPGGRGLKEMKAPQPIEAKPITRIFLMSIMRSLEKSYVPKVQVEQEVKQGVEKQMLYENSMNEQRKKELAELKAKVEEFKEASGLDITNDWKYPVKELGRAVKAVINFDERLNDKLNKAKAQLESIQETCASLESLKMLNMEEKDHNLSWKRGR